MLELEHRFRVVDVHARLTPDDDTQERGRAITPDRMEREMHQAGVVRSLVFPGVRPGESYVKHNNAVARHSVERPFAAVARIDGVLDPGDSPTARLRNIARSREPWQTSPEDVEQYAYDDRFHGFAIDPAADGVPDEAVLEQLDDVELPVIVKGGDAFPPDAVESVFLGRSFPVVVAHFGGHPLNRDLMDAAIDRLDDHENCYLDTSFVRYRDRLERALMEHPSRVLFGSGAPDAHPNVGVMELLTLDVSEDRMRRAFSKNAARLFPVLGAE